MPKGHGRGRRRQGARRFEQKPTARTIEQPTVQKTTSPTTTSQAARAQRPTQDPATSVSHVRSDIIRVGVVTMICILLLIILWAVLR